MRFLWTRMKLVVEPTGALPLAALFESRVDVSRKKVGVVISGGNIDLDQACRLFASCPEP
jgi:threonine dehydratase